MIIQYSGKGKLVFPDFVFHDPNNTNYQICVGEIKRNGSLEDIKYDLEKLNFLLIDKELGFTKAVFIGVGLSENVQRDVESADRNNNIVLYFKPGFGIPYIKR